MAMSAALAAAVFVKAFGVTFLGQPRSGAVSRTQEVDRLSLAAMALLAALCLLAGILPGLLIDGLFQPVTTSMIGAGMPAQDGGFLSIVPIAESRSSYNGLLVFLFIAISAALSAAAIHRFASRALRRAPAWGCGYPQLGPAVQYTSSSFAQPLRRVFGAFAFRAREKVYMPPPGDPAPARFKVELHDLAWDAFYRPITSALDYAAGKLNHLQFLTIRRYLTLVFVYLVILLLVLALWS
jgi:hypothetical protein